MALSQKDEIRNQINIYTNELNTLLNLKPQLADLMRDESLSEAILAAALANVEYSESNYFEGYPQIQIIEKPNPIYSHNNSRLKRLILGFIMTCILSISASWLYVFKSINFSKANGKDA